MAQLEHDLIRERVKAGLERAKAMGVRLGRPPGDVDEARVMEAYSRTNSIGETAKQLGGGFSRSLIFRILRRSRQAAGKGPGGNRDPATPAQVEVRVPEGDATLPGTSGNGATR